MNSEQLARFERYTRDIAKKCRISSLEDLPNWGAFIASTARYSFFLSAPFSSAKDHLFEYLSLKYRSQH